jgi:hypothetical protein
MFAVTPCAGESSLSLAKRLIEQPLREKGGSTAQERFDYQALWGLALIFTNHNNADDYAIAFEFHDDVMMLDSATAPAAVRFYQVKTKKSGHWTLGDLFRRPAAKPGEEKPHSPIGKLFQDYQAFPDHTDRMCFVSNVPLEFGSKDVVELPFSECDEEDFKKFLGKLRSEHPGATDAQASLMQFVRADLSLHDADTHTKGKLHNFVVKSLGDIHYSLDTLYRAIVEDCRTRSKYTGDILTFEDLIRFKAITRADVDKWLAELSAHSSVPEWPEVASDLELPAITKAKLRREWMLYRTKVLDAGDEGIRAARRRIDKALASKGAGLSLADLLAEVAAEVSADVRRNVTPLTDERLSVMILYEVYLHGEAGELQAAGPQPSDKAL